MPTESSIDVLFLRHGAPDYPAGVYPDPFSMRLSADGRAEAALAVEAVDRFRPDSILSSDFVRAIETAEIATRSRSDLQIVPDLRERVMFSLVGTQFSEISRNFGALADGATSGNSDDWDLAGEEGYLEAHKRVVNYFAELSRQAAGQRVLVVAHGGPHAWMIEAALGVSLRGVRTFGLNTGHFSRFTIRDRRFSVDAVNLPPAGVEPHRGAR